LRVIITFDLEFSIAGAFSKIPNCQPIAEQIIEPEYRNRKIGFYDVLTILESAQVKATFFTEVLNTFYFGFEKMQKFAQILLEKEQDVQVHLHPCWSAFKKQNWKSVTQKTPPQDNVFHLSKGEIENYLYEAKEIFYKWGVPEPRAFRAGNLQANMDLYRALKATGYEVSSNIGMGALIPDNEKLQIKTAYANIEGITEYPVTSYKSTGKRNKILTVCGSSFSEMKNVIDKAYLSGVSHVIILSHIHEFIKKKDFRYSKVKPNRVNLARLEKLCHYVNSSSHLGFSDFGFLPQITEYTEPQEQDIHTRLLSGVSSILQNKINDRLWAL